MNRVSIFLTTVVFLGTATLGRADDAKEMQGTWVPVDGALAGTKLGDEFLKGTTLKVDAGAYEVLVAGQKDSGMLALDAGKKPKTMDIKGSEGPNKGKTFLAIYELKGDTLRICYDLGGTNRPTDFVTTKENKWFVLTYQRKK